MRDTFQIKILKHLLEVDAINDTQIDITDFLKTLWRKDIPAENINDLNRIKTALDRLQKYDLIFYSYSPKDLNINEYKNRPGTNEQYKTSLGSDPSKDEVSVKANITWKGYEYIVQEIRNRQQDELNKNTIATNTSLQAANTSTNALNTETARYYNKANWATWTIAGLTTLSAIIAGISALTSSKALKENHQQFVIETTPVLQISTINDSLRVGKPTIIYYSLVNLGKDQAKIISAKFGKAEYNGFDTLPFEKYPNFNPPLTNINSYAIKESPYSGQWTAFDTLRKSTYDSLITGQIFIYFFGKVKYINLVSKENRQYYFNVQIFQQPKSGVQYLYNENQDSSALVNY